MAEALFGTANDPDQIPVTDESLHRLRALAPDTVLQLRVDGQLAAWVVAVPTTRDIMERFLAGHCTEADVLTATAPAAIYAACYLCAAVTLPRFRRRGYAGRLVRALAARLPLAADAVWFGWPTTAEGAACAPYLPAIVPGPVYWRSATL